MTYWYLLHHFSNLKQALEIWHIAPKNGPMDKNGWFSIASCVRSGSHHPEVRAHRTLGKVSACFPTYQCSSSPVASDVDDVELVRERSCVDRGPAGFLEDVSLFHYEHEAKHEAKLALSRTLKGLDSVAKLENLDVTSINCWRKNHRRSYEQYPPKTVRIDGK